MVRCVGSIPATGTLTTTKRVCGCIEERENTMTAAINTNGMTLRDFFADVPTFAVVLHSDGSRVAWSGRYHYNGNNERTHAKLLNMTTGLVYNANLDVPAEGYGIAKNGAGEIEIIPDMVQTLLRGLLSSNEEMAAYRDRFRKAEADWDKLGELLTAEANRRDWCSEYDRLVEEWNDSEFQMFELPKRKADYDVTVTVTATYTVTVTVEAEDEDAARELVEQDYDAHDVMRNSSGSFQYPDEADFEVDEVSRG